MTRRFYVFIFLIALLMCHSTARAQEAGPVIRGKVLEKDTRKPLEGMMVYIDQQEKDTAVSARDGSFVLPVEAAGDYSLIATGLGYERSNPLIVSVGQEPQRKETIIYLMPVYAMTEVVVEGERNQDKTAKIAISGKELTSVPGSAGDPLRGMQALPGITTANDASSNPAIRGSGPQNNMYYVDFLPVGYLFHLGGLISVINAGLVEDFNIFASSFGPEFGNVTGGVIDVKLRNPRKDRVGGIINISTFEADALLEGPLSENRSIYLGARRSYYDLFVSKQGDFGSGVEYRQFPQYYDFQGKYVWDLSDNHSLTFTMNGANDQMKLTLTSDSDAVKRDPILAGDLNFEQSYNTAGAVLTSRFSPRVNNKLGISYLETSMKEHLTQLGHIIIDEDLIFVRDHLSVATGENNELLFGIDYGVTKVKLDLNVPVVVASDWIPPPDYTSAERFVGTDSFAVKGWGIALKDRWKIIDPLTFVLGGRISYDDYLDKHFAEPRLGAEYTVTNNTLATAGWGKYHEFPEGHQVIEGFGNPHIDYEKADHYDLGVEQKITDGWSLKVEEYYKKLHSLVVPHEPENYINGGTGKAYGTEVLIKKDRKAAWSGWVSFGYSKTERQNDLTGENFNVAYDQPYIVNVVYEWKITPKWTFGAKWRYQSGAPFTPVTGTETDSTGRIMPTYGALGSERLPSYHRLDLKLSAEVWSGLQKTSFYVEIFNAYNHENISGYEYNEDYTSRKPVAGFPIMPAFGIQKEF